MTIREQIIQELEQVPETQLEQILELVRSLRAQQTVDTEHNKFWQAYLASKKEREEVYHRLANS